MAAGLLIFFAIRDHITGDNWWQFAALCALAVFQAEVSRKIEQTRRLITNAPHVDMTSVWVFGAAIVLPPSLCGALVIVVYVHLWLRIWRKIGNRPIHRVIFTTTVAGLSTYAAIGVLAVGKLVLEANHWTQPFAYAVVVYVAGVVLLLVNNTLVTVAARLYGQPTHMVVSWADYALEISTLCLGALCGLALLHVPYLVVLVLPPLLVLHRAVLVKQLEDLASLDQKTGLLNATAWHESAKLELSRAARTNDSFGVLMVDLDFFKKVNDTYGHLAGDEVLKGIARLLKGEIRDYDSAGRFGGEEFAVLIPNSTAEQIVTTAERLRRRVTELEIPVQNESGEETVIRGLSASIGVAIYPNSGTTLEQLMLTADSAVYTAKSNGRNQVVTLST
ncbi:GGDEF domain-containing protein [Actinocrispum sp. NPDC049592]|uniref:sensor domain-containing diguanylate cyclase n=1 Tax=Actinocrispum sp. NPDC049592 TaxID=3154835 RepID=UPI0034436E1F